MATSPVDAALSRLSDPAPPVRRLAVAALCSHVFAESTPITRQGLDAVGSCLSHEREVRRRERGPFSRIPSAIF